MVDYKSIGRRIALFRKEAKITQATLAEHLEVSESFVSQIERGKAKVSLSRLYQIAQFLDMDVALLVSDCRSLAFPEKHSEIEMIIKDWTPDERALLIDLLICANSKKKPSL